MGKEERTMTAEWERYLHALAEENLWRVKVMFAEAGGQHIDPGSFRLGAFTYERIVAWMTAGDPCPTGYPLFDEWWEDRYPDPTIRYMAHYGTLPKGLSW